MRPDAVNWANKRTHVDMAFLPRPRASGAALRWLALMIVFQFVLAAAILCFIQGPWRRELRVGLAPAIAGLLAHQLADAELTNEPQQVYHILHGATEQPGVMFAAIVDNAGRVVMVSGDDEQMWRDGRLLGAGDRADSAAGDQTAVAIHPLGNLVIYTCPIMSKGGHAEHRLLLGLRDLGARRALFDGGVAAAMSMLVVALIALPLACIMLRRRAGGLHRLHAAIRRLAQGEPPEPLPVGGCRETDYLHVAFNDMASQLFASRRELVDMNRDLDRRVTMRTEQWRQASRLAEQASQAKSRFLATMSHEIRTPLNGVIGSLSLLNGMMADKKQQELVRTGWLSANSLLNLINDILDFSSFEAGKLELSEQPFHIQDAVEQAVTIVAPMANQKQIDLTYRIHPATARMYNGDPARLRQVMINLINNAIKFTDSGYVEVTVNPQPGDESALRFEVRDTGIGIPHESFERIFKDFTQAGNDQNHSRGGTGLGLTICKQLIGLMGGEIGVESEIGRGSTFWFTVRLSRGQDDHVMDTRETMQHRRVILLETGSSVQQMVSHCFEPIGYEVICIEGSHRLAKVIQELGGQPVDFILVGRSSSGCAVDTELAAAQQLLVRSVVPPKYVLLLRPQDEAELLRRGQLFEGVSVVHRPLMVDDLLGAVGALRQDAAEPESVDEDHVSTDHAMLSGMNVLLVEDNPINQFITQQILTRLGVASDVVSGGHAAIAAMQERRYHAVLMDYFMPDIDGLTACREIRRMEESGRVVGRTPIVALTANVATTDREACFAAGMDDFLAKPIDIEQLKIVLTRYARHPASQDDDACLAVAEGTSSGQASAAEPDPLNIDYIRSVCPEGSDSFHDLLSLIDERFRDFKQTLLFDAVTFSHEQLSRLGHTIAGCALQSGAEALAASARRLEAADEQSRSDAIADVSHEIDRCLGRLGALLPQIAVEACVSQESRTC